MKKKTLLSILALAFAIGSVQAADYNIKKYGAVSDTTRLSTKAVQRAIDACSAAGGGRVVVPTGGYKIGSIFLKSNVHLYLELGATLYGSTNINDYQPVGTDYVSLRTQQQTVQLIFADKVSNVSIDGYGTIDGQGYTFKKNKGDRRGYHSPPSAEIHSESGYYNPQYHDAQFGLLDAALFGLRQSED